MERAYERNLGTILVAIGVAILLFVLYQGYEYTMNPPTGTYNIFTLTGGNGGGGGSANGTFNGIFISTFVFLIIQCLVGAFILKAGWNLITPKAETIQVRIKPKYLRLEPVEDAVPASSSPAPPGPVVAASGGSNSSPPASTPSVASSVTPPRGAT